MIRIIIAIKVKLHYQITQSAFTSTQTHIHLHYTLELCFRKSVVSDVPVLPSRLETSVSSPDLNPTPIKNYRLINP
jgi:hypothetical protein